jgi:hypothetical protein
MRKWFVVGIESMTAEQEKSFLEYIRDKRMGWWHWIPNLWLITGSDAVGCSDIRDKLMNLAPAKNTLVLAVNPVTWAGFGPKSDKRDMFRWLNRTWGRTDD